MRCIGCKRSPEEIQEYVIHAHNLGVSPREYVRSEEGTFNPHNEHFACTDCYIAMGVPSSRKGWVAP